MHAHENLLLLLHLDFVVVPGLDDVLVISKLVGEFSLDSELLPVANLANIKGFEFFYKVLEAHPEVSIIFLMCS